MGNNERRGPTASAAIGLGACAFGGGNDAKRDDEIGRGGDEKKEIGGELIGKGSVIEVPTYGRVRGGCQVPGGGD
jgi:hypothetical protein